MIKTRPQPGLTNRPLPKDSPACLPCPGSIRRPQPQTHRERKRESKSHPLPIAFRCLSRRAGPSLPGGAWCCDHHQLQWSFTFAAPKGRQHSSGPKHTIRNFLSFFTHSSCRLVCMPLFQVTPNYGGHHAPITPNFPFG